VDAHLYFLLKPSGALSTKSHTHTGRSYGRWNQIQHRVQASAKGPADYGFVLYPTKQGQRPPEVGAARSGALHVKLKNEEHLIFLFPDEQDAVVGPLRFRGRCGVAKRTGDRWSLILLSGSRLSSEDGPELREAPASAAE